MDDIMGIELKIRDVKPVSEGLWEASLSPREVRCVGVCHSNSGRVSVILLKAFGFDGQEGSVSFSPDAVTILNVGTSTRTVIVAADPAYSTNSRHSDITSSPDASRAVGGGDQQFLLALDELPSEVKKAGEAILTQVRQHFPGDLRAVSSRRFQETPDNFWFIAIQPRDRSLSITVRGLPERFSTERLKVVEDRRPYSRFKVTCADDVPEAVEVISKAVRKSG